MAKKEAIDTLQVLMNKIDALNAELKADRRASAQINSAMFDSMHKLADSVNAVYHKATSTEAPATAPAVSPSTADASTKEVKVEAKPEWVKWSRASIVAVNSQNRTSHQVLLRPNKFLGLNDNGTPRCLQVWIPKNFGGKGLHPNLDREKTYQISVKKGGNSFSVRMGFKGGGNFTKSAPIPKDLKEVMAV